MSKKTTTEEELEEKEEIEGFEPLPEFGEEVPEEDAESSEQEEPESKEGSEEKEEPKEETEDKPQRFEFVEPESEKPFMTAIHRGKEISIATEEDARRYIQKGFDYDVKVGPHGKLARTLDEHPEFAKRVAQAWDEYVSAPKETEKPSLKNIDEYEDPNEWLMDNFKELSARNTPAPQQPQIDPLEAIMVSHDPQNYATIKPHLKGHIRNLTIEQYEKINNDLPSFIQWYDWVKEQVIKPKQAETPNPPFRVKSGGGEPPSTESKPPWEAKNNAEFEDYMAKVKGIHNYR